jgi:hypothetical protein
MKKVTEALSAGLLFFIVSNPVTYTFVDSLLAPLVGHTSSSSGCPTTLGLIVHSIVFIALTYYGIGL